MNSVLLLVAGLAMVFAMLRLAESIQARQLRPLPIRRDSLRRRGGRQ